MTQKEIAAMIDHTLLNAYATKKEIKKLCTEAKKYKFASVCVNPIYVEYAKSLLAETSVKVCTVIGFPLGAEVPAVKEYAAKLAVTQGADEVDMVIDIGSAKDNHFDLVEADIKGVVTASKKAGKKAKKDVVVKVIIETCYLTDDECVKACKAAVKAGADFVKTSTGFGTPKAADGQALPNGASVHHVELMKKTVGDAAKVKASGGIRSARTAAEMVKAGADRLGTSSGLTIVESWD